VAIGLRWQSLFSPIRRVLPALVAVVLLGLMAPSTASSYELWDRVWTTMPVSYCVNTSGIPSAAGGRPIVSADRFVELVREAFQKWEDLLTSKVSFSYAGLCDGDPSGSKAGMNDGMNTVGWAELRLTTGGQTSSRATKEHSSPNGLYREILEADIAINTDSISTLTDPVQFVATTLPHVLLHEAGHFIGLAHSKVECSVMSPSGFRTGFCKDDIDAVATLYP
jgi:hypothetical protein